MIKFSNLATMGNIQIIQFHGGTAAQHDEAANAVFGLGQWVHIGGMHVRKFHDDGAAIMSEEERRAREMEKPIVQPQPINPPTRR